MRKTIAVICLVLLTLVSIAPLPYPSFAADINSSPPPTPPFILTVPRVNEITYVITVKNLNASWVTIDFALPSTRVPDTYVKIREIKVTGPEHTDFSYADRENSRLRTYVAEFHPGEQIAISVSFYSLKYKLDISTHQPILALSYPNEYTVFTQQENYIESDNSLIINQARTLVGNRTNPFRIAEKMYDFARSHVTWISQPDIRGALWALQNGRGDCTEFGTLFVSLMRAVGIPARTVVGHAAIELAQGGIANSTSLWVDSPHLWAEFYVDGYGWVPVDPTFGKRDPESHFGKSWAYYLPLIKGPTMDGPNHSLVSIRHPPSTEVTFTSELVVTPSSLAPLENVIQDLMSANERTNLARRVANKAFDYSFNIMETYPLLEGAYDSLGQAISAIGRGDLSLPSQYSAGAREKADQTLQKISAIVVGEAQTSISSAWKGLRILGALGGEYYLRVARSSQNTGDYLGLVQGAYFARATADQAPSFLVYLGPLVFSVFVVGMVRRKNHKNLPRKPRRIAGPTN